MKSVWLIVGGAVAGFVGWQVYQKLRYSVKSPFYKSPVPVAPPRVMANGKNGGWKVGTSRLDVPPTAKYNSNQVTAKQTRSGWMWYNAAGQTVFLGNIYFLYSEVTTMTENVSTYKSTYTYYKVTKTGQVVDDSMVVSSYPTPAASQQLQGLSQNVLVY